MTGARDGTASPFFARRPGVLIALVIAAGILNYWDRQIIAVLKPVLEKDLGWTDADYGTLISAYQMAAVAAFPLVGWLIDRIGAKWANPLAVASWSLAAAAHAVALSFGQFLTARVGLGITEAMGTPTAIKTFSVLFDDADRSRALGLMNGAATLGAIATPLVVPGLALAVGWRTTFLLAGTAGLAWAVVWVGLVGKERWSRPADEKREAPWSVVLTDRRTWLVGGAKALSDAAWWFLLFWTPDYFHRSFGLDLAGLAFPVAAIYGMAAMGSLVAGFLSARLLRAGIPLLRLRQMSLFAAASLVLPVPTVLLAGDVWQAVVILGLALAGHQAFSVNIFAMITEIVPEERIGRVTAMGALCGNLSGMAILQSAGLVLAAGHGYGGLFAAIAVAYFLAPFWVHRLAPRHRAPMPVLDTGA